MGIILGIIPAARVRARARARARASLVADKDATKYIINFI